MFTAWTWRKRQFRFGAALALAASLLASSLAEAVLPPDMVLLVSGESVRSGGLPESLAIGDGVLTGSDLAAAFSNLPLADDALYSLTTDATSDPSVRPASAQIHPGMHAAAIFSPGVGIFEIATISGTSHDVAARTLKSGFGSGTTLGERLAETGSFAIMSPDLLAVPEPAFGSALAAGIAATACFGARRFRDSTAALVCSRR